ncbi:MAG: ribonuclease R [Clostridia bacterium]|nr:ribonuclease R [Clostridia bacterium]
MTLLDILANFHIMPQFPPGAMRQAEKMPKTVSQQDKLGRRDLSDKSIITIDGDDAKDFDDAISIEILENRNYLLGVHIADVTHYVTENSPIDRAAFARGTSVYLIDTVVPMLPFELSNELCSLKPNVERLAVSVFMEITPSGKVENYEICESVIVSKARMTYANVTKILEGDKTLCEKYSQLIPMLKMMKTLADILKKKRVAEGSVEFETHESKITLDKDGKPVKVERYPITISNDIIEEFMLICNVTVATHLTKQGLPCVYRVHEKPDLLKVQRLGEVLPLLGVDFTLSPEIRSKDFQDILKSVKNEEKAEVINYLLLRSMAKAKYRETNLGHFGLGFGCYCHFTSPIRRYPDMIVHRILKESLKGGLSEKRKGHFKEVAVSASITSSTTEINAAEAELRWKAVKKAEFMADKIGEKYDAIITHVTNSGFFAELSNTVEGFVAARTLMDDVYVLAENGVALQGLKTKRTFCIGDKIKIKVAAVDLEKLFIDFEAEGTGIYRVMQRKSGRKSSHKKDIGKKEKRILRELSKTQKEEKAEKSEMRRKAETEKQIFENALISVIFDELQGLYKFKRAEKGMVGVMLFDMAANISQPCLKSSLDKDASLDLERSLVSGAATLKNTLNIIADSFEFSLENSVVEFCVSYTKLALSHFEKCLRNEDLSYTKRENEYLKILKNLQKKGGKG